jgi:hypothetical protein
MRHTERAMNAKRKAVLERIESFEEAIAKAKEYLESGKHAHWAGFRPLFVSKFKDGKELPPHNDWVKNVFLPQTQRALPTFMFTAAAHSWTSLKLK